MERHVQQVFFELSGMRFSALSAGREDGELVLLLHGFPQFADAWADVMRALAGAGFRVIAPDQRGYSAGARPTDIADYHVSALVADVLALADALGADKFHLVGHDWGGLVAWRLSASHPERLRTLTVLSTPHGDAFREALAVDPDQQAKSQYIQLFRMPGHVAEDMLLASGAALLRRVYQGRLAEKQVENNVQRLAEPGALTAALNWYRALRVEDPMGAVHVPTLYIWGDQDLALGRTAAEATARFVDARYRFEPLAGVSHWIVEDAPHAVRDLVLDHLASRH